MMTDYCALAFQSSLSPIAIVIFSLGGDDAIAHCGPVTPYDAIDLCQYRSS